MRRGFKIMAVIGSLLGVIALGGTAEARSGQANPDRDRDTTVATVTKTGPDVGVQVNHNGVCEVLEVCLYYNSNCQGSFADFAVDVANFAPYTFVSPGAGQGQGVKNNAASARNRSSTRLADIHFNSNYMGPRDRILRTGDCQNLVNTYNENASLKWR